MKLRLHHLALRTNDVAGLARFYREMFGFEVVKSSLPRAIWMCIGNEAVLMVEKREAGEPEPPKGSMELIAFAVDEAGKTRVRLKSRERGCYDGETEYTVYLRDPEGRRVGVSTYDLVAATK